MKKQSKRTRLTITLDSSLLALARTAVHRRTASRRPDWSPWACGSRSHAWNISEDGASVRRRSSFPQDDRARATTTPYRPGRTGAD